MIETNFVMARGYLPYLRRFCRRHVPRLMGKENFPHTSVTCCQAQEMDFQFIQGNRTVRHCTRCGQNEPGDSAL